MENKARQQLCVAQLGRPRAWLLGTAPCQPLPRYGL